ncbi:MAG: UDP-N-acetylmuramoyl-L-alanyl-D-glutamate--2,6-diaminopimelate ligase [Firmicutes bacterium]|nr:UDP-N-acetylmuramoyl-L-alanyl-D-glutamate--2,6-diaminopimelate ligase [Candidatus Colimorpha enterica]
MKTITLNDICLSLTEAGINAELHGNGETEVTGLSFDTRRCADGDLFFCKGAHFRDEYLTSAAEKGCRAYISEKKYDSPLPCVTVPDIRWAMSVSAKRFYREETEKVDVIGVTGTNGKTTTVYYIKSILDCFCGKETALLSSNEYYDGNEKEPSHLTTPEAIDIFRHIGNAADCGIKYLEMEISSQALKYDRVSELKLAAAVFNNVDNDHISPNEHSSFEDYYSSKLKIFDIAEIGAVNADDPHAPETLTYAKAHCGRTVTYGKGDGCDVRLTDVKIGEGRIDFTVSLFGKPESFTITMPGLFNVTNAMAAISVCHCLGVPADDMRRGLLGARAAGRMEIFRSRDGRITAIVDYAHNRMSFETLYNSVKIENPGKKIIAVFGCAGNKAYDRRHDLPDIAGHNADYCVITDDDSGEEGFEHVAATIEPNIKATGCPYIIMENRDEAVKHAILENGTDKVVVITGKGIETTQKHGLGYIDVPSDIESAQKYIAEYDRTVGGKS